MAASDAACALVDAAFDALERIDVTALPDEELHAFVLRLHGFTSRLAALRSGPTGEWDRRGVWGDDGSRAAWARLAREQSLSEPHAKAELARAKKLRSMPVTAVAFAEGKLSEDQVGLLCGGFQDPIAGVFAEDESMLVAGVTGLNMRDAARYVDYWVEHAYALIGAERSRPDPAGRRWRAVRTIDGHVDAGGWLDPMAGTEYLTELQAIERELFEADWAAYQESGTVMRTHAQRFADAQVEMARRSRAYREGRYRQPRPLLTVHVGEGTFRQLCELSDGTVVSPHQVVPVLTEADIEVILFDGPQRVLSVSRRERFFTGALRRAIEARDRHCQHHSGCTVPAELCQIDHKTRFADGGETTQENGRCLCAFHNRHRENHPEYEHFDEENERPPPGDW